MAPTIAPDGTVYVASVAHFADSSIMGGHMVAYLVAVNPDLTAKWVAPLQNILNDGCGVTLPIAPKGDKKEPNSRTGISRACWLNSAYDMVDINVEETEHVVLLVRTGEQLFVPWKRRSNDGFGSDSITSDAVHVGKEVSTIEVTLLDAWKRQLLPRVAVKILLDNGQLSASIEQH